MNVEEALIKLGLHYEDKGDKFKLCCPFHNDTNPSFSIYKDGGSFICFSCGKKGPLKDLIEHVSGLSPEEFGLKQNSFVIYKANNKKTLKDINISIEGDLLPIYTNKKVLDYCWTIGFTNEFIKFFNIKYFKEATFINHSLTEKPKTYYNRIIIPVLYNNQIYNYECRDFTKRSYTKILYPKGAEPDILFNWDNINKNETVYICEGIKGLSHIWSYYSKNVVSIFGKIIKDYQKELLATLPNICLVPDNDENKINKKTGKPVDNVLEWSEIFDEFYPNEYEIAYINKKGADPANLTREQIKFVLDSRKSSSEILIKKSGLFETKNFDYLQAIK